MSLDTLYLKNDTTSQIGEFVSYQEGWSPASAEDPPVPQAEIDAYLLAKAKTAKLKELFGDLENFLDAGYTYQTNVFKLTADVIENIQMKNSCPAGMTDRYKFCDIDHVLINFTDAAGFTVFLEAIFTEKDRVMVKYNAYKIQIAACADIAEVDAIVIDFAA